MKIRPFLFLAAFVAAFCAVSAGATDKTGGLAPGKRPDTALYGSVLQKCVKDDGRVDYARLKSDIAALAGFVLQLGAVSPDSHPGLFPTRDSQLAYWINAYNALVLYNFAKDYPEKRDRLTTIPGKFSFFYRIKNKVGGKDRTLDDIEVNSIRKAFREPRVHFALVCASASCPWLSRTAYEPEQLNARLEEEAQRYFQQDRNFRMDERRHEVTLPRILEWFKEDFGTTQEIVLGFVAKYRPAEAEKFLHGGWKINYFDYDWSPNDAR
jgi:hypothetical protein